MKWKFRILLFTLISFNAFAQTPEKMSYQAVIRNNSDVLIKNSQVDLKIIVRNGSPKGSSVYQETHHVKSNKNGLVSLEIGTGSIEKGLFSEIDWSEGPFFIETLIDPEGHSNYTINGVSQMLSVPYALHAKSADYFTGTLTPAQMKGLNFYSDADIDGNEQAFNSWDKNADDDFSGDFNDLINLPNFYTADQIDNLLTAIETDGGVAQSLSLKGDVLAISNGNSVSFENWDTNAADDFSGMYNDLQNKPELYNKSEIDNIISGIETNGGISQNLNLDKTTLTISGGNSISFDNWDTNVTDDFSGIYDDLQNKPELFSGEYNALKNVPSIYTTEEVDNLIAGIETKGGISQNLNLDKTTLSISGGNSISFDNWDTNVADDFSGMYDDLQNKPDLFSGEYNALKNVPNLYTVEEVDNLIAGIETTDGVSQNLNLDKTTLSISGGNSISFENWDTNAVDDFSGVYDDLQNKPDLYKKTELYNKSEIDNLIAGIETTGGVSQNLNLDKTTLSISGGNSISFANWDTNVADDFSGMYDDLQNKPELFSGEYNALKNVPNLYTVEEVDNLIAGIETNGEVSQNLNLDKTTLSISGGNSISFNNWDTNVADDFSGVYDDLQNKPELYKKTELYNKSEIDNLIAGIETTGGVSQNLNLDKTTLSISGGNSISFDNWDTNAADDFSGVYDDLQNKPDLYNKTEIDNLLNSIQTNGGTPQNISLNQNTLSISNGNSITFDKWDTNAEDDFDGKYSSLTGAPKVYTQAEVDAIKVEIMQDVAKNYAKKSTVVSISSSRNANNNDVGNTIACTSSATLTLSSALSSMQVGEVINLEVHGTTLKVQGNGTVINGKSNGSVSIGNNSAYTGGLIRKTGNNSYIVL